MTMKANSLGLVRRGELETCVCVTRTHSRGFPNADERRYEGMLMSDVRVGVPLVVVLNGRRRLVTSVIRKIEPMSPELMYVETFNSRYRVRRLVALEARAGA
jgi:hypothetical protein